MLTITDERDLHSTPVVEFNDIEDGSTFSAILESYSPEPKLFFKPNAQVLLCLVQRSTGKYDTWSYGPQAFTFKNYTEVDIELIVSDI